MCALVRTAGQLEFALQNVYTPNFLVGQVVVRPPCCSRGETMRAIILAAGIGWRLGRHLGRVPKSLLRFGGKTLLQRHFDVLGECGVTEVVVGAGYRADLMQAQIDATSSTMPIRTVLNPDYEEGNIVTLWTLRDELASGEPVLLMDADVLYDKHLMYRLIQSPNENCFLLDRDLEPGDEPVKLCVRDGRLVEFRKHVAQQLVYDFHGESVGFFKLSAEVAGRLRERTMEYIELGRRDEFYEEALRDVLLEADRFEFGFEDITGLPWIEIDFPEDVRRAEHEILPRLDSGSPARKPLDETCSPH